MGNVSFIVTVLAVCFIGYLLYTTYGSYTEDSNKLQSLKFEVSQLSNRIKVFENSKNLVKNDVDSMNTILSALIPETEDFFSIISALEKISVDTKFAISNYSIGLTNSTRNKLAISVEGAGDISAFENFLKLYPYVGGRFVTCESIDYSQTKSVSKSINLNFYSGSVLTGADSSTNLTKDDAKFISIVKSKTEFILKDEEEIATSEAENYAIKSNPFSLREETSTQSATKN